MAESPFSRWLVAMRNRSFSRVPSRRFVGGRGDEMKTGAKLGGTVAGGDGVEVTTDCKKPKGEVQTILKRILPHVLLLIAASLYTVGGGYAFYAMERNQRHAPAKTTPSPDTDSELLNSGVMIRRRVRSPDCPLSLQYALVEAARRECVILVNETTSKEDHRKYCATLLTRLSNCFKGVDGDNESLEYILPTSTTTEPITSTTPISTPRPRHAEFDHRVRSGEWTPVTCIFMAFTIISTIGYGDVAPVTSAGRLFCILYGMIGIPLALLAVADQGRFLTEFVLFLYKRSKSFLARCLYRKGHSDSSADPAEIPPGEDDDTMPALLLIGLFALYLLLGGCIFTRYEPQWSFVDAVYFTFISSATIGFGDEIPANQIWLPFTLLYVALGLALATAAIDICAEYLRRLHNFGAKIRNCANKLIWFGGKRVTIGELVRVVGNQFGVSEEKILDLVENFDAVVEQTIVEMETGVVNDPTPVKEPEPVLDSEPTFTHDTYSVQMPFIDSPCTTPTDKATPDRLADTHS